MFPDLGLPRTWSTDSLVWTWYSTVNDFFIPHWMVILVEVLGLNNSQRFLIILFQNQVFLCENISQMDSRPFFLSRRWSRFKFKFAAKGFLKSKYKKSWIILRKFFSCYLNLKTSIEQLFSLMSTIQVLFSESNTFHSLHQSTYKVYTEVDEENCYYEGLSNQITTSDKLLADGLNHLGL